MGKGGGKSAARGGGGSGGSARRGYPNDTNGRMVQVESREWQGANANGAYAAVTKMPANLNSLNKEQLSEIAKGLGEPNKNIEGAGKKSLISTINSHGSNVYRVGRKNPGDWNSGYTSPLYTTNKATALTYARGWLRSNK